MKRPCSYRIASSGGLGHQGLGGAERHVGDTMVGKSGAACVLHGLLQLDPENKGLNPSFAFSSCALRQIQLCEPQFPYLKMRYSNTCFLLLWQGLSKIMNGKVPSNFLPYHLLAGILGKLLNHSEPRFPHEAVIMILT